MAFATSVDPDQPEHVRNLICICTGRVTYPEAFEKFLINCRHRKHTAWMCRHLYTHVKNTQRLDIAKQAEITTVHWALMAKSLLA